MGYDIRYIKDYSSPYALKQIIDDIKDNKNFPILSNIILRSMEKAVYSTEEKGHFALGAEYHTHFTAAIRRFVDLVEGHILHDILSGKMNFDVDYLEGLSDELSAISSRASHFEKMSDKAEREAEMMEMASFMNGKAGECFDGFITEIKLNGLNVKTEDGIKGFVSFRDILSGNFKLDRKNKRVIFGNGVVLNVCDEIKLQLVKASVGERAINFKILDILDNNKIKKIKKIKKPITFKNASNI